MDVVDAASIKPLVEGHSLARSLNMKPGRWMSKALEACLAWQFDHPEITNADDIIQVIKSRREELDIPDS